MNIGEKGLTHTFLLAHVIRPDSGRCADWIIYNAPRRHTTGNKNFIMSYSESFISTIRTKTSLNIYFNVIMESDDFETALDGALKFLPGIKL